MIRIALPHGVKLLLAAAFVFSVGSTAFAQEVRLKKLWYGAYTVSKEPKEVKDPTSPSGTRFESVSVNPPASNSSDIVLRNEIYFGIGFMSDADGNVEEIYLIPDSSGLTSREPAYRRMRGVRKGQEHFFGWFTGDSGAKGSPPGRWTFQLRQGERVLLEHSFNLTER